MNFLQILIGLSTIYYASALLFGRTCRPRNMGEKVVSCEKLGKPVEVGGGLYSNWELHYNLMMSTFYAYKMADAFGLDDCCPSGNSTLLEGMNLITTWSGTHGAIAVDSLYGFDLNILRRCVFPAEPYPFLCTGSAGTPTTEGEELGTLSYISLLHDEVDHKWTLFGHCWNAKTPENPDAVCIGTSFNVFSLDPELPPGARDAIIIKLKKLGFDTNNIIEPDFIANPSAPQC